MACARRSRRQTATRGSGSFFPHPVAERTTQWERGDEPMTQLRLHRRLRRLRPAAPAGEPGRPAPRDLSRAGASRRRRISGTLAETQYAQRDDAERYIVDRVSGTASFEIVNDGSQTVFDLYGKIQAGTAPRTLFAQTFNYYDGDAFVGLPFGQLGDFGALVRTESLVLTEEILREAYRDPANPDAPDIPPYLRPEGVTSWPAEYPAGVPGPHASAGRLHLRRWLGPPGARLLRPSLARRVRFSDAGLAAPRTPCDARATRSATTPRSPMTAPTICFRCR